MTASKSKKTAKPGPAKKKAPARRPAAKKTAPARGGRARPAKAGPAKASARPANGRLLVRDLMTENVFSVRPTDTAATVYDLMDSRHIRHLPVIDEDGKLIGLVSHRDLMSQVLKGTFQDLPVSAQRELLGGISVDEMMAHDVETVGPESNITEAAAIMLENKFSCVPVTEDEYLVGILTEADFVKFVARSQS